MGSKIALQLLKWLAATSLVAYGIKSMPDDTGAMPERVRQMIPWLTEAWVSIICLTLGSALVTFLATEHFYERRLRKGLRRDREVRFKEMRGEDAIEYLLHESSWAWKKFAKLNFWEQIPPDHFDEFRRAALSGALRTVARDQNTKQTVYLDRRYWIDAWIVQNSVGSEMYGVCTERNGGAGRNIHHLHLSVSEDDVLIVWPRASPIRRLLAILWVITKRSFFRISPSAIAQDARRIKRRYRSWKDRKKNEKNAPPA